MAIKISNLEKISEQIKPDEFSFKDLRLDFQKTSVFTEQLTQTVEKNDVMVDYDQSAIKNSLRNLFNTRPGQRILFPEYGLNLYQFVFEPITETNAYLIGEKIVKTVETFEPRVNIRQCKVQARPDDNEYEITLIVDFPNFNTVSTLNSILDIRKQSFIFVQSQRNK